MSHVCETEHCTQEAVEGANFCTRCKCSYGRLLTCKEPAELMYKRCRHHREKVGARMKKKYHETHLNSRENILARNQELQKNLDQFLSIVQDARERKKLAQEEDNV